MLFLCTILTVKTTCKLCKYLQNNTHIHYQEYDYIISTVPFTWRNMNSNNLLKTIKWCEHIPNACKQLSWTEARSPKRTEEKQKRHSSRSCTYCQEKAAPQRCIQAYMVRTRGQQMKWGKWNRTEGMRWKRKCDISKGGREWGREGRWEGGRQRVRDLWVAYSCIWGGQIRKVKAIKCYCSQVLHNTHKPGTHCCSISHFPT